MDCRSVPAPFGWRCLSTPPCSVSSYPSKIPYVGFSHSTAPNRHSPDSLPMAQRLLRAREVPRSVSRRDPPARPCCSAPVKRARVYPGRAIVCCRVRMSPPHCVPGSSASPAAFQDDIVCGPRVLSSAGVMLSPASSVLRPDVPGSVPPHDFALCAYTCSLAVRGRSRRGRSPSSLCPSSLPIVPSPVPRRASGLRTPTLRPEMLSSPRFARLDTLNVPLESTSCG